METSDVSHRLFGPLPTRGIWTALELTRGQFLFILALSVGLFVFIGGPVWLHTRHPHFWRIGLSYASIPPAVALALLQNGNLRLGPLLAGSAVIGLAKLVLTAALLVMVAIAQS